MRHKKGKHISYAWIKSLLDDIVANVTESESTANLSDCGEASKSMSKETRPVYPPFSSFEQEHYDRIAACKAEFQALYPSFNDEVRALRCVQNRPVVRKKKLLPVVQRKSARISSQAMRNDDDQSNDIDHDDAVCNNGDIRSDPAHSDTENETHDADEECDILDLSSNDIHVGDNSGYKSERFSCLPCGKSFR